MPPGERRRGHRHFRAIGGALVVGQTLSGLVAAVSFACDGIDARIAKVREAEAAETVGGELAHLRFTDADALELVWEDFSCRSPSRSPIPIRTPLRSRWSRRPRM